MYFKEWCQQALLASLSRLTSPQGSVTVKCRQCGAQHLYLLLFWGDQ